MGWGELMDLPFHVLLDVQKKVVDTYNDEMKAKVEYDVEILKAYQKSGAGGCPLLHSKR